MYTEMDINRIYIELGDKCNFSCKYCCQKFAHIQSANKINNKIIEYIKRIVMLRPKHKKTLNVVFWGGEPLLYMDAIKEIVYKLHGVNVKFGTVTNGSLLTNELVEYFNQNNFSITISNDGIKTAETRNTNILEDNKMLSIICKLHDLNFDSVICALNDDFLQTIQYIRKRTNREDITVAFEWLMCDKNTKQELYNFNYEHFSNNIDNFLQHLAQSIRTSTSDMEVYSANMLIGNILNTNKYLLPKCGTTTHTINVDTEGNIYVCHGIHKIGTIDTKLEDIQKIFNEQYNVSYFRADCSQCEYVYNCKAGCPLEIPCDGKMAVCKAKKIFFKKVLDFAKKYER